MYVVQRPTSWFIIQHSMSLVPGSIYFLPLQSIFVCLLKEEPRLADGIISDGLSRSILGFLSNDF